MPTRRRSATSHRPFAWALALALAALAAGCYRPAPATPADDPALRDRVADALLTERIRAKLLAKLGTDALGVEIVTRGDRVLLTGAVDERSTQHLAQEVAASVRGVRRIDNRIALVPRADRPGPVGRAAAHAEREVLDAALESRVKAELLRELGRYALDLEVEAADGAVSLRGWVPDPARERIALDTAGGVRGVGKVIDLIRVGLEE
jgi:osmotically-inducible protein OsmY